MTKLTKNPQDFSYYFKVEYLLMPDVINTLNLDQTGKLIEELNSCSVYISQVINNISGDDAITSCQTSLNNIVNSLDNICSALKSYRYYEEKYEEPLNKQLDELKEADFKYKNICANGPDDDNFKSSHYDIETKNYVYKFDKYGYDTAVEKWEYIINQYENNLKEICNNIKNIESQLLQISYKKSINGSFSVQFFDTIIPFIDFGDSNDTGVDDFFLWLSNSANNADSLGIDQGMFRRMEHKWYQLWYTDPEYKRLQKKFEERGMTSKDVVKFFNMIDSQGACTYARAIGDIVHEYKDNPQLFEEKFKFPLYTNDANEKHKLNTAELLADMFLYFNDEKNGGDLWNNDGEFQFTGKKADSQIFLDFFNTGNGESYSKTMTKYLASHGINSQFNCSVFYNSDDETKKYDFKDIQDKVKFVIDNKNTSLDISVSSYNPNEVVSFYPVDKEGNIKHGLLGIPAEMRNSGHAVNGVDYNDEGIVVNTWGDLYLIKWEDIAGENCSCQLGAVSID